MNNSKPGGIRHRRPDIGGRPRSDANYGAKKSFGSKPRFDSRSSGGGNRPEGRGKDMQMFTTNCTTCGKSCEVPFRPDGSKPVLCRDCFALKNAAPGSSSGFERRGRTDDRKPERSYDAPRVPAVPGVTKADLTQITSQITALESKISELLVLVKSNHAKHEELKVVEAPEVAVLKTKTQKVKKEAAIKKAPKAVAKKAAK